MRGLFPDVLRPSATPFIKYFSLLAQYLSGLWTENLIKEIMNQSAKSKHFTSPIPF